MLVCFYFDTNCRVCMAPERVARKQQKQGEGHDRGWFEFLFIGLWSRVTSYFIFLFWRFVPCDLFLLLCVVKRSRFMQRAVITDLNGAKMETSSGHTLTCQPHFSRVDVQAAVPSFFLFPLNSFSTPTSPSHSSPLSVSL